MKWYLITLIIILLLVNVVFFIMYMRRGRPLKVILWKWINKKRVFDGIYNGKIKKRYSDGHEEQLFIPCNPKIWTQVPDSSFCVTDMNGIITVAMVIDNTGNHYFIRPDDTLFTILNTRVQEPITNKNGEPIFEDVYIKDENGDILFEPQFDNEKKPILDLYGQQVFKPKIEKRQKFITVDKQFEEPAPYDRVIENDVKLYFLNKKEELRQKYKKDEKKSLLAQILPFIIIGIIVIFVVYMTYGYLKDTIIKESEDRKQFYQMLTDRLIKNNLIEPENNEVKPSPIVATTIS